MKTTGERLAVVENKVDIVCKEVLGNGKDGLSKDVVRLVSAVSNLTITVDAFRTAISGFNKFQIETETIVRQKATLETHRKWLIATIFTIIGVGGTVIGIIIF